MVRAGERRDQWGFALAAAYRGPVSVTCDTPAAGRPPPPPRAARVASPPPPAKESLACPLGVSYYTQVDAKGVVTALLNFKRWRPGASA